MDYNFGSNYNSTRKGESDTPSMRTDRLYRSDGHWYIRTREAEDIGPYDTYHEVTQTIPLFVDFASKLSKERVEALIENHNMHIEKRSHSDDEPITADHESKKAFLPSRVYAVKDLWFYKTLEGRKIGPYKTLKEIQKVSDLFDDYSDSLSEKRIIELLEKYIQKE